MKPAPFGYHSATSVGEAVRFLAAYEGTARLLAGGQSLVPMLNMRLLQPDALIDINGVHALGGIADQEGEAPLLLQQRPEAVVRNRLDHRVSARGRQTEHVLHVGRVSVGGFRRGTQRCCTGGRRAHWRAQHPGRDRHRLGRGSG